MIALKDFERLEAMGLWRAGRDAQRRDVIVSVGEATLTLTDNNGSALAHWSLPAIERINPGEMPALFRPGPDATETLELDDDWMISAIEKVQAAIARRRPRPGRLRAVMRWGSLAALAFVLLFWLPRAMVNYAASIVPEAKRAAVGEALLADLRHTGGNPQCDDPQRRDVLKTLHARLFGGLPGRIVVLDKGDTLATHLPGHVIALNRSLLDTFDDPGVAAGFALAEAVAAHDQDPLERLLKDAGMITAFRLLTTGEISADVLAEHANTLSSLPPASPDETALADVFKASDIRPEPYIEARKRLKLAPLDLAARNISQSRPVLSDGDWVRLQTACLP